MISRTAYFWKRAPFVRVFPLFAAGIVIQWYGQVSLNIWCIALAVSFVLVISFFGISLFRRYKLSLLNGIYISFLFISAGGVLAWFKDIRNNSDWLGKFYEEKTSIVATLIEPPVEKTKSLKADADVNYIINDQTTINVKGKIILYFKRDSLLPTVNYGTPVIFNKSLQKIKNSGNPGSFDYKRYSLFQQTTHQVYLKPGEFEILRRKEKNYINSFLYSVRDHVLNILRTNIKTEKESGLAEALLIGYKDDLDKTLVQSYSNTGVVHIIAISGMHLALIYWLLHLVLKPLGKRKKWRWVKPVVSISVLWLFSLLTGASASVLRAAVMFSFIILADSFSKKSNIYNTLSASAFCLLCYNPYWLWDVGFQLSYAAVLSIVVFMRPIYNLIYCRNKLLDRIWQLNSVTLAAQLLTTPLSIYHFHQFPVYFFLTNLVAVPLSSAIVLGEILLCAVSFISPVALVIGKILSWLIMLMNACVERIESLPGSLWDGLQVNTLEVILLFVVISGIGFWLLEKMKQGLTIGLIALLGFFIARTSSFIHAERQQMIIVYNLPQRRAIDFVNGRDYFFYGDSDLLADDFIGNFHLMPSRIFNRLSPAATIKDLVIENKYACYKDRKILFADTTISFSGPDKKYDIDLLIVSENPKLNISSLSKTFNIKKVVFDGSAPFWKLKYWKKDCDSLHISYHDVSENGAFVMNLN